MQKDMEVIFETEEFIVREITWNDLDDWYKILSDEETMRFYPKPFDMEKIKNWIEWNLDNYRKYGFGLWAVILKENNEFIGDIGMTMQNIDGKQKPEIGYHIAKKYWGRGYAPMLAKAVLDWAFKNTKYEEICSHQKYTNIPSRRVAEKVGMTFRKEYPDVVNTKTSVYSILRKDFQDL